MYKTHVKKKKVKWELHNNAYFYFEQILEKEPD